MTPFEVVLLIILAVVVVLAFFGQSAAYQNGVTDGYGYSVEPNCPGYRHAGEFLKESMAHRWPELVAPKGKLIPPQGGSGLSRMIRGRP